MEIEKSSGSVIASPEAAQLIKVLGSDTKLLRIDLTPKHSRCIEGGMSGKRALGTLQRWMQLARCTDVTCSIAKGLHTSPLAGAESTASDPLHSGSKEIIIGILRSLGSPATYEELWQQSQSNPQIKSKRYMKTMVQQLKKSGIAKSVPASRGENFKFKLVEEKAGKKTKQKLASETTQESIATESLQEQKKSKPFWSFG